MNTNRSLSPGWCWATVEELIQCCIYGSSAKTSDDAQGVPVLRMGNIQDGSLDLGNLKYLPSHHDEFPKLFLQRGDLLFNRTNSAELVGKSAVYMGNPSPCSYASYLVALRLLPECDPKYLCFFLNSHFGRSWIRSVVSQQVGQANVNSTKLRALQFPLAPLNEQRRIVAKIDEQFSDLDAAVILLRRVKARLKRYRASVLKAAIDGKLTAEWRRRHTATEPATALLERILIERRRRWEDAQRAKFTAAAKTPPANWQERYEEPKAPDAGSLPPLPEGWCWTKVDQLGEVQLGRQRSPGNVSDKYPTKYVRAANLTEKGLDLSDVLEMEFLPKEKEGYVLRPGDLLLSEASGSPDQVGKPVMWRGELEDCCFQNTVIRLRPTGSDPEYLLNVFRHLYVNKVFAKVSAGVGINHLSAAKFSVLDIPLPPADVQVEIVREIEARLSVIEQVTAQVDANLKRAGRLRQGILKRAFEGKLVPQIATDEPATVLLERIRQQRQAAPQKPARKPVGGKLIRAVLENLGRAIAYCLSRAKKPHGRTWLAKVLAIGELHVGIPFKQRHGKYPHGPFDDVIYKAERVGRKAGWFDFTEQKKAKEQTSYLVTAGTPEAASTVAEFFGERKAAFDQLIADFDDLNSDEAELLATAYTAWNDLLIDGRPADEDAIVAEFYAWDESKTKFSRDQILSRIAWMRQHDYVPAGRGQRTTVVEKKTKPPSGRKKQPRKA